MHANYTYSTLKYVKGVLYEHGKNNGLLTLWKHHVQDPPGIEDEDLSECHCCH